ncbi:hypothetical protein A2865_02440 [Candidatus Woesebacteria bacterium RIFCSPHIGHO2_01_FULL_39_17]|uniref:Integral membrane protein n=3 Tax=Candidatus Woeseibacteriota TaxID=1752722 RepID=A0A0G0NKT9_9BACT|nr:MAG: hypothetical protein US72_C0004G0007 [Microgenomates group bacterium GW2011_GWC1_38_12]KKQ93702.1 MAG: hypothetical protein UT19_C0008G0027 [Candidatus Woesebacteria bacterium GW2011_GWB1_39_10b]KKR13446.1 MAG: hypothetical protein UT40_C0017G0032 [Candidatus Woesebacteria bacterium GW2011_GWA1_39_21b]OGM24107.1 MAG: hypothetical protein A2865_02440 [Candidatus Woesebacteria bacterium RIFCSPHIGHO2_01_FULL_39_17]OGM62882.1 MAG: hypothetical protein A3A52_03650 [Candidatus Woesebacteria b
MNTRLAFNIGETFFGRSGGFLTEITDLGLLVSLIFRNALVIAGVILLFLFVFAGFQMISGSGDPQKQQRAQQIMTAGIIGFILIILAYFIIRIIEVSLGVDILGQIAG